MCRKRGRIVLVGVTGLDLSRADFFEKELSFQVSCSYGPGRYDPNYEEKGQDYPVGYVRWTEQRNLEAVLDMMADGRLDVMPLISHRFPIDEAAQAYELIGGTGVSLGILLEYPPRSETAILAPRRQTVKINSPEAREEESRFDDTSEMQRPCVAFIGSGNYATTELIPAFKSAGARLKTVASSGGVSGLHAGRKFGFEATTTDTDSVFADPSVNALVVATRHDSHASLVQQGLAAGKHIFVEKPLCLTLDELASIATSSSQNKKSIVMVGFNRRFAPQVQQMKLLLASVTVPKALIMTVNVGAIPVNHWTQDRDVGGGRIVGEVCHFVDLLRFLAGAPIVGWQRLGMRAGTDDTLSIQLAFADGSIGTVHYFANGNRSFPKERLEVFAGGRVLQLDNYRNLTGFGWTGFKKLNLWRQDKGQKACAAAFVRAIHQNRPAPIPLDEILEVSRVVIEIAAV
jgi:predicted dehydrogenase